jgi:transposase
MARPTDLDDLVEQRIVASLRLGNTPRQAAQAAGISVASYHAWRARGRKGEPRFVEFLDRTEKAAAEAEGQAVEIVRNAALSGTWQAAAWWLERRRWKAWARRDAPSAKANETSALDAMTEDELKARAAELAAKLAPKETG